MVSHGEILPSPPGFPEAKCWEQKYHIGRKRKAPLRLFRFFGRKLDQPAERQVFRAAAEGDLVAVQFAYIDKDGGGVVERHFHLERDEIALDDSPFDGGFTRALDHH